jgi:SAM-dependent methyltransferase
MLESTSKDRPRLGKLVASAARRARTSAGQPRNRAKVAERFARNLDPGRLAVEDATVTGLLFERLSEEDVVTTEQLIGEVPVVWEHYAGAGDEATRRRVLLARGVSLEVRGVVEKTGLTKAEPPEDVHAMARGPLAVAGALYDADLVVNALASTGAQMASVGGALDFGCSSGRVVRALQAAYPSVRWHGCDPNEPAIAWARGALPAIDFSASGNEPPLALESESLDLVYAISIWSHFAPQLGLRWFEEMRRLIRPGGHLVCTSHGFTAVEFCVSGGSRSPAQADEIVGAMYRDGWWYAPEFGERGDWGVVNPEWGNAFLSPEWLLTQLCPRWRVLEFAPGRNQRNQDVYVLQRV